MDKIPFSNTGNKFSERGLESIRNEVSERDNLRRADETLTRAGFTKSRNGFYLRRDYDGVLTDYVIFDSGGTHALFLPNCESNNLERLAARIFEDENSKRRKLGKYSKVALGTAAGALYGFFSEPSLDINQAAYIGLSIAAGAVGGLVWQIFSDRSLAQAVEELNQRYRRVTYHSSKKYDLEFIAEFLGPKLSLRS